MLEQTSIQLREHWTLNLMDDDLTKDQGADEILQYQMVRQTLFKNAPRNTRLLRVDKLHRFVNEVLHVLVVYAYTFNTSTSL
jgi:hypothetical protein